MKEIKIGSMVNLLLNVIMGVVLGITGQWLQGSYSLLAFVQTFFLTMGIGYLLGSYVPVMKIGQAFAGLFGARDGIMNYLISTFAVAVVMVNLITFCSVFIQAGTAVWGIFVKMIPTFLIVGVIAIEASLFWIQKIALALYTK